MWKELANTQKRLLTSFFLFGLAAPMVNVYSNTFLWRQDKDPITLALFNIGTYGGVAMGFLLNAYFLRRFQSGRLYALGCVLQGIVPVVLVALGAQANTYVLPLGLALGIAMGFFWGNRNAITSKITHGPYRYRFISLETVLGILAGIIAPLAIGWFIALSGTLGSYRIDQAYQITSVLGFLLLLASGVLAWSYETEPFETTHVFLKHVRARWNTQRLLECINGMSDGFASVLPLVMILLFLGQEEAVGTIKSIAAILSALAIHALGKHVKHHHHTLLFGAWILFNLIGGVYFALFVSAPAAIVYFLLTGLVGSFRWSSLASVMYEIVDQEIKHDGAHRFLYLFDRECFLNAGRILGLGLLMILYTYDQTLLVRYGLLLMTLIQLPVLILLHVQTTSLGEKLLQEAS